MDSLQLLDICGRVLGGRLYCQWYEDGSVIVDTRVFEPEDFFRHQYDYHPTHYPSVKDALWALIQKELSGIRQRLANTGRERDKLKQQEQEILEALAYFNREVP